MKKVLMIIAVMIGFTINGTPSAVEKQEPRNLDIKELSLLDKQKVEFKQYVRLDTAQRRVYYLNYVDSIKQERKREELKRRLAKAWKGKLCDFLVDLGRKESGNNYAIYNKYGYIGAYQMGPKALKATGYGHITFSDFKNDHTVFSKSEQIDAVIKLTKLNRRILRKYINEYSNTMIDGVLITESSLLAAAHLGGAGGVMKYLDSGGNSNPSDAYGTSIRDYMEKFSGYEINFV
jgi:hypothetical protein